MADEVRTRGARVVRWAWLGRAPYAELLSLQEQLREGVIRGTECETLLLAEHHQSGRIALSAFWARR